MIVSPVYLRRDNAAQHVRDTWGLPCSPRWLAKLAVVGGGPIYRKAGRTPIYAPAAPAYAGPGYAPYRPVYHAAYHHVIHHTCQCTCCK